MFDLNRRLTNVYMGVCVWQATVDCLSLMIKLKLHDGYRRWPTIHSVRHSNTLNITRFRSFAVFDSVKEIENQNSSDHQPQCPAHSFVLCVNCTMKFVPRASDSAVWMKTLQNLSISFSITANAIWPRYYLWIAKLHIANMGCVCVCCVNIHTQCARIDSMAWAGADPQIARHVRRIPPINDGTRFQFHSQALHGENLI